MKEFITSHSSLGPHHHQLVRYLLLPNYCSQLSEKTPQRYQSLSPQAKKAEKQLVCPVHKQDRRTVKQWVGKSSLALLQAGALDFGMSDDAENKTRYIKLSEAGSED